MPRPNPIEYAERLYSAIRAANFSPISFLAFGNAVKDGVELRRMPRIAAEPFMRVAGEMLDWEGEAIPLGNAVDAQVVDTVSEHSPAPSQPGMVAESIVASTETTAESSEVKAELQDR
jgi:hypothetical protein